MGALVQLPVSWKWNGVISVCSNAEFLGYGLKVIEATIMLKLSRSKSGQLQDGSIMTSEC